MPSNKVIIIIITVYVYVHNSNDLLSEITINIENKDKIIYSGIWSMAAVLIFCCLFALVTSFKRKYAFEFRV